MLDNARFRQFMTSLQKLDYYFHGFWQKILASTCVAMEGNRERQGDNLEKERVRMGKDKNRVAILGQGYPFHQKKFDNGRSQRGNNRRTMEGMEGSSCTGDVGCILVGGGREGKRERERRSEEPHV